MKDDAKAIFTAAAKASQAAEYLIGLQPAPDPTPASTDRDRSMAAPQRSIATDRGLTARSRAKAPEAKR